MPRQPRYFLPGIPQHVIARGVDRQPTFFQPEDYDYYRQFLEAAARRHGCAVHAYVLMTNHVHLLLTPHSARALPRLMQAMGRYVQDLNKSRGRTGTLWEGRYRASLVQDEVYLLTCQRYIELNPVRARITRSPGAYRHSSYRRNALGCRDPLVTPHPVYLALAEREQQRYAAYRRLFDDEIDADSLKNIRATTNACLVMGNNRFRDQIEAMLGRSVRHGRKGRPRKTRSDPI